MLLNALSKHSKMRIAGQLEDSSEGQKRLKFFKTWEPRHIDVAHPMVEDLDLDDSNIVVVKQGIWEHPWPFDGFILVRNPVSIYASLMRYDHAMRRCTEEFLHRLRFSTAKRRLRGNYWRFYRWFRDVDADFSHRLDSLNSLDLFCSFYNRRMGHLLDTDLPVVHYEQLASDPEGSLKGLCSLLSVPFEPGMLGAGESVIGHGKNDLGREISDASLYRVDNLTTGQIDQVLIKTHCTWNRFGYRLDNGHLRLPASQAL